jgi:hypothetical protein
MRGLALLYALGYRYHWEDVNVHGLPNSRPALDVFEAFLPSLSDRAPDPPFGFT